MLIEYISVTYCLLQLLDWWKHCVFHHLTAKSFFDLKTCVSLCWSNLITLTFLNIHGLYSLLWLAQNFIISIKTHLLNPFALLQGILVQIQLFELILNKNAYNRIFSLLVCRPGKIQLGSRISESAKGRNMKFGILLANGVDQVPL